MRYKQAIIFLSCWVIGTLLGSLGFGVMPLYYWLMVFLVAVTFIWRKHTLYLVILGLLLSFGYSRTWHTLHWRAPEFGAAEFSGIISAAPDLRSDKQYLTVTTSSFISKDFLKRPATTTILVAAPRFRTYNYGDLVHITGELKPPETFDSFNYPLFLERAGIFSTLKAKTITVTASGKGDVLTTASLQAAEWLEKTISSYLPEPESSFLAGLLLGAKRSIPSDVTDSLRLTGTSHLVAISGANITIVVGLLLSLIPVTHRGWQFVLVFVGGIALCLMTGNSASVLRGAVVAIISSGVRAIGRRPWPGVTILLAAVFLLILNPLYIRADPGFQLSFAAYGGLLIFSGILEKYIERIRFLPKTARTAALETTSASLGTAPLSFFAGSLAPIGLIVNPSVLWLIPWITIAGISLLVVSPLPPVARFVAIPTWFLLHCTLAIIQWFSRFVREPT